MKHLLTHLLILSISVVAFAQEVKPATSPDPSTELRFTVDLIDGSRIVGSPVTEGLAWKTGFGVLNLKWNLLRSVEKIPDKDGFTINFKNNDIAKGTSEINKFSLRTVFGELAVPFTLTKRIWPPSEKVVHVE